MQGNGDDNHLKFLPAQQGRLLNRGFSRLLSIARLLAAVVKRATEQPDAKFLAFDSNRLNVMSGFS